MGVSPARRHKVDVAETPLQTIRRVQLSFGVRSAFEHSLRHRSALDDATRTHGELVVSRDLIALQPIARLTG